MYISSYYNRFMVITMQIVAHIVCILLVSSAAAVGIERESNNYLLDSAQQSTQSFIGDNLMLKDSEFIKDGSFGRVLKISKHGYSVIKGVENIHASAGTRTPSQPQREDHKAR